jgi:nucleoside-diphosphate-sugar epimerase
MTSDGTPWRPLVHGLDIARAIIAVLQAPSEAIHNEVFNVGDTSHNYRVREIAERSRRGLSWLSCKFWSSRPG